MQASRFTLTSIIDAPINEVWDFVTSPAGINTELMPVVKMTVPPKMKDRPIRDFQPGAKIGRSWLLLGGLIPIDFDNITLTEIEPGRRFLECSTMGSMRRWQHERKLEAKSERQTEVTDHIEYVLRLPIPRLAKLIRPMLQWLFRHRHKQLKKHFGRPLYP